MSRVRQAFLEDICANPEDDAPRLVFADWLDDHGEADRGEFIRAQVALAKLPPDDPTCATLRDREKALLANHEEAWQGELPKLKGVRWGRFARGFVTSVGVDGVPTLSAHAAAVFAAAPIRGISFRHLSARNAGALAAS